jgi:hypothetical protein
MMFGPMGLTVTALIVASAPNSGWRTTADIIFLALLAITILARWIEFAAGDARNGMGEPVARADIVRYSIIMASVGLAAWICANVVANHIL